MIHSAIDSLIGKIVQADLGAYTISGRLISARNDELTLQTKRGSRIVVNKMEARSIREVRRGGKKR
jgi:hypothetical protein